MLGSCAQQRLLVHRSLCSTVCWADYCHYKLVTSYVRTDRDTIRHANSDSPRKVYTPLRHYFSCNSSTSNQPHPLLLCLARRSRHSPPSLLDSSEAVLPSVTVASIVPPQSVMVYTGGGRGGGIQNPEITGATSIGEVAHGMHLGQAGNATGCARLGRTILCLVWLPIVTLVAVMYAPFVVCCGGLALLWPSLNEKNTCFRTLLNRAEALMMWPAYAAQQVITPERWEDDWSRDPNSYGQKGYEQPAATTV